jgi:lipoprotein-anchoring transpeptidase ErfK/SrfK
MFTTAAGGATAGANEIKVSFHNGTAVKEGTIVRQKGSKRFVCAETGAADTEHTCVLTTGKLPAALSAGEMSIMVLGADSETYTVSKITARKATVIAPSATGSNALDGTSVAWQMGSAASAGVVRMEEAGDDDVSNVDDDDFTDDA